MLWQIAIYVKQIQFQIERARKLAAFNTKFDGKHQITRKNQAHIDGHFVSNLTLLHTQI